jgi:uncharacterized RDD family membrane protein YckC
MSSTNPFEAPKSEVRAVAQPFEEDVLVEDYVLATPFGRWLASIVDSMIVGIVSLFAIFLPLIGLAVVVDPGETVLMAVVAVAVLAYIAAIIGYGTYFEGGPDGATPGKKMLGLRVVDPNGHKLDHVHARKRNVAKVVLMNLPYISLLFVLPIFGSTRRTGWDRLAATQVIKYAH